MKILELIQKLNELSSKHGNVDIVMGVQNHRRINDNIASIDHIDETDDCNFELLFEEPNDYCNFISMIMKYEDDMEY